ncbi:MAG: TrpB-like pyridoxal-phosphate dependent enzyme, partial [Candidatus Micrarchaeota archaeon]
MVYFGVKVLLQPDELPRNYYNLQADLPAPLAPPLNPATKEPVSPSDFEPIFPKEIIRQEMSSQKFIRIPDEVREAYLHLGRPTPLYRAKHLEQ